MGRSWKTWGLGGIAVAGGLLFGMSVFFSGCMSFSLSESEIQARFQEAEVAPPRYFDHVTEEGSLRVVVSVDARKPSVVFVHGSPGSWDNFIGFLTRPSLLNEYCLVAVDRPGFGRTTPRRAEPSITVQARRIREAVSFAGARDPAIWIGHSLAGPVVCRLAIEYPEAARGLVLVAPSLDPQLEKLKWYNWLGKLPPINWGLGRAWRNSNNEIFPHRAELRALQADAARLTTPTVVVHGEADTLVPVGNAYYAKETFGAARIELRIMEGADHFIPWSSPEAIVDAIETLEEGGK